MIHGDLKGVSAHKCSLTVPLIDALQPNILVDGSGHACITDFGLIQDTLDAALKAEGQSTRWTAPEILKEIGTPSTEADVFSFGMVMIEVCQPNKRARPKLTPFSLCSGTRSLLARFRSVTILPRRR